MPVADNMDNMEVFYPIILHEASKKDELGNGNVAFCTENKKIYFKTGDDEAISYGGFSREEIIGIIRITVPESNPIKWDDKNAATNDDLFKPLVLSNKDDTNNLINGEMAFCIEDRKIYFKTGERSVETYGGVDINDILPYIPDPEPVKWITI